MPHLNELSRQGSSPPYQYCVLVVILHFRILCQNDCLIRRCFTLETLNIIMVSGTENKLLDKIRGSQSYKSAMSNLRSRYDDIKEESSYLYQPDSTKESHSIVVIRISGSGSLDMDLIFKVNDEGNILNAEAEVDSLSGVGKPNKVDEYLNRKTSIKDKIRSLRQEED